MNCSIDGCNKPKWTLGANVDNLCRPHLRRKVSYGDPLRTHKPPRRQITICDQENCHSEALCRGMCQMHYKQAVRANKIATKKRKHTVNPDRIYYPTHQEKRKAERADLLAVHRANPLTQAINW